MSMRASRLVNMLLLLQTRGGLTATQLSEQLEISVRTVYRDVDALSEAGVPIYTERGPRGGVRLVDGYRTRLTGLTSEEAEALFLSGVPGPAAELGLGTVVAAARLKVLAALPPELRLRASRLAQRFHLDAPAWFRPAEAVPHLESLAAAVWDDRRVVLRYERCDRSVERMVDPLGLVVKAGIWYLIARTDAQIRTYRVSRIRGVTVRDERFERPDDFHLVAYWTQAVAAYGQTLPTIDAVLRVHTDALGWLAEAVGEPSWSTARTSPDPERDGWVRVELRIESIEDARSGILRVGAGVEVVEPQELRAAVIEGARSVLERHGALRDDAPAAATYHRRP
jgi:predicted DNA-binding transcriptional regulator YafY